MIPVKGTLNEIFKVLTIQECNKDSVQYIPSTALITYLHCSISLETKKFFVIAKLVVSIEMTITSKPSDFISVENKTCCFIAQDINLRSIIPTWLSNGTKTRRTVPSRRMPIYRSDSLTIICTWGFNLDFDLTRFQNGLGDLEILFFGLFLT